MKAVIFNILLPGLIKTYDKPLLTFLKHLLAYPQLVEGTGYGSRQSLALKTDVSALIFA